MIRGAIAKGADVIVTGDVDYHSAIDAVSTGNRCDPMPVRLWNRMWIYRIYETGIGSNVSGT